MMNKRELIYSIAEQTGYTQSAVRKAVSYTHLDVYKRQI